MERIPYLGKYIGTHQEPEGLPPAGSTVLLEGETDSTRKKAEKASKSVPNNGLDDAISYVRVRSSDVAARI
jgi:hypothetical protein